MGSHEWLPYNQRVAEVVVYRKGDVLISSARVSIGHATYPLANVTAINVRHTLPFGNAGIAFILASAYFIYQAIVDQSAIAGQAHSPAVMRLPYLELAAGIGALLVGVWLRFLLRHFHLTFNTGTRQVRVLSTYSRNYIDELAFAVKQAIVARG
jgi:Family of unknown function (DUF6232)